MHTGHDRAIFVDRRGVAEVDCEFAHPSNHLPSCNNSIKPVFAMTTQKRPTLGVIVGNRGFFPAHLADTGRKTMLEVLAQEGHQCDLPDAGRFTLRHRRKHRRRAQVRRPVQGQPRRDRRHPRHAAQLRRRARRSPNAMRWADLNVPVLVQAFPDDAGQDDDRGPPRQLLRQDVRLQQPDAVRHPVLADHAAHGATRPATSSRKDLRNFAATCRVVSGLRTPASARSARGPRRSTPCATARSCSKRAASRSRRSTCPRSSAASARMSDDDAAVKAKLDAHPRAMPT